MTAGDSIVQTRKLTIGLVALFVLTAAFTHVHRTYSQKFLDITRPAKWIWARHPMSANVPVAFFAVREIDLPAHRIFTHLKLLGDPEYTLYVNGREAARRRVGVEEKTLAVYDISELVKTGRNRVVVAVRAPLGVGGLIAGVDIAPETENWIVTDGSWKIYRRWSPEILLRDPPVEWQPPLIVGEPPIGRWNYLTAIKGELATPPSEVIAPRERFDVIGLVPTIRTEEGIAVAVADRARATAFDFGFTKGRLRLTLEPSNVTSRAVNVRFANIRDELEVLQTNLRPVVVAPGESTVTTTEEHSFRYAMVFGKGVINAEVLR